MWALHFGTEDMTSVTTQYCYITNRLTSKLLLCIQIYCTAWAYNAVFWENLGSYLNEWLIKWQRQNKATLTFDRLLQLPIWATAKVQKQESIIYSGPVPS